MQRQLQEYILPKARVQVLKLLECDNLVVKIKSERKTRHGDYRKLTGNMHQITINENLNSYRFIITLIHEIAHLEAYKKHGNVIKPHGIEWKMTFQHLMLPFLNPDIFPDQLLSLLAKHLKNPKASTDRDAPLTLALKQYDAPTDKICVFQVPLGATFKLYNGKVFERGRQLKKRFECTEIKTGKRYLFNPNAEVEHISTSI